MPARFATIDIGTNSVLLLVAEKGPDGRFQAVCERAEITRLGRGVDASRTLSPQGMEDTLRTLETFAAEARRLGAEDIAVTATSAARDASNGAQFLSSAKSRAGLEVEIISGELEAQLSYASAYADFATQASHRPLVVIDIGGGSTEFIWGGEGEAASQVVYRKSFDVGSVRLTERFIRSDPPTAEERSALKDHLRGVFTELPRPPAGFRVIAVAGTATTLFAIQHKLKVYDAAKVHGGTLTITQLDSLSKKLGALKLEDRRRVAGLQPKRADVICAGAAILLCALERLAALQCWISDRGVRWGMLQHRFGAR